jgi:transcriptional regulator with XRE-family HTH domain
VPRRLPPVERLLRQRLAANTRRLRAVRELTVMDAAERAGMHWRHWQKVEAGDLNATIQTLARVARVLGVEAADLFRAAE